MINIILKIAVIYVAISLVCLMVLMMIALYDEIKYWWPQRKEMKKKNKGGK